MHVCYGFLTTTAKLSATGNVNALVLCEPPNSQPVSLPCYKQTDLFHRDRGSPGTNVAPGSLHQCLVAPFLSRTIIVSNLNGKPKTSP